MYDGKKMLEYKHLTLFEIKIEYCKNTLKMVGRDGFEPSYSNET